MKIERWMGWALIILGLATAISLRVIEQFGWSVVPRIDVREVPVEHAASADGWRLTIVGKAIAGYTYYEDDRRDGPMALLPIVPNGWTPDDPVHVVVRQGSAWVSDTLRATEHTGKVQRGAKVVDELRSKLRLTIASDAILVDARGSFAPEWLPWAITLPPLLLLALGVVIFLRHRAAGRAHKT